MKNSISIIVSIILAMASPFMWASNASAQDKGPGGYRNGYGSYETMGQNPDELMKYGQDMMRYGFHEMGMPGGSNKYPGYGGSISDGTIKKLNAEQEAFITATQNLRDTYSTKRALLESRACQR